MKKIFLACVLGAMLVPAVAEAQHSISAGVGVPICAFGAIEDMAGSSCISGDFLWFNVPIVYRYRVNDWFAAGGGLMLNIFAGGDVGAMGGELVGSLRFYAVPEYLYFDADILLGFPFFFSIAPSLGLAVPIGSVSIFLENQVPLMFIGGVLGFWQPVLGVEFRF